MRRRPVHVGGVDFRAMVFVGRDEVRGYFAMRKFEKRRDAKGVWRFFLNNEPYFIIGTLDQGWWPDGLLTYDRKVLKFSPAVLKAAHDRVVSRAKAAAYAK